MAWARVYPKGAALLIKETLMPERSDRAFTDVTSISLLRSTTRMLIILSGIVVGSIDPKIFATRVIGADVLPAGRNLDFAFLIVEGLLSRRTRPLCTNVACCAVSFRCIMTA